ncbi:MAG: hypothetical protein RL642_272 [Bacteroidota bacterium]
MNDGKSGSKLSLNPASSGSTVLPSGSESLEHDLDFGSLLAYGVPSSASSTPPRVKAVRLNVYTLTEMLETSESPLTLPYWSRVNRIIFQGMGISAAGQLDLYPKVSTSVLNSPVTYLEMLRELRRRFGIQLYIGMPLVYAVENLTNNHQTVYDLIRSDSQSFFNNLAALVQHYQFDGIELNLEGVDYIPHTLCDDLLAFPYRHKLMLTFKNNDAFINHHGLILKRISELVECLVINAYGYFKYNPLNNKLLPKCDCSVKDWLQSFEAYESYEIPTTKLMIAIESTAVLYFLDSENFNEVESISFTPLRVVEQLRRDGEVDGELSHDYTEHLDREKNGSILVCRSRGVIASYDNMRMKAMKFRLCRDKELYGCILGNPREDVSIYDESNLINLMDKYI